jgi:very-short-patch-repair endonuclease
MRTIRQAHTLQAGHGATRKKLNFARALRRALTPTEIAMWAALRRRAVGGWKFRKQHVVAGFLVDFYCSDLRLAVEIDGTVHELTPHADAERTAALSRVGVTVVRVSATAVHADIDGVLREIEQACEQVSRGEMPL